MSISIPITPEEKADFHMFTRKFKTQGSEPYRPSRREAFEIMAAAGERVVPYFSITPQLPPALLCVVYVNEAEHATKGKELLSAQEALDAGHEGVLASQFLGGGSDGRSRHTRLLVIGNRAFRQQFTSNDSWRGNAGDVDIQTVAIPLPSNTPLYGYQQALYAIDYVHAGGIDYAVDFNVAPGIPTTTDFVEQLEGGNMLSALLAFYETHPKVSPGKPSH